VTAETLVLPDIAPVVTYRLTPNRYALELVVRFLRIPLGWVRLRVITARVDVAAGAEKGLLHAEIATKPMLASLPFARRWAFASMPRGARIQVEVPDLPRFSAGESAAVHATATAGGRTWTVPLVVRVACLDERSVVLAVRGRVARPPGVLILDSHLFVDAAAELVR
jgi:hypothetical protein